ncbi:TRAPP trafficking subunit Trs65-domain-containing protein [Lipomyces orientalis]|uniref:TRAPP trafficking subunit Trs65-domain-containing protein n=1 Tax=Lipomyces orientalis TaxID=1233043 RepID=A0ACC3TFG1_9ASCO
MTSAPAAQRSSLDLFATGGLAIHVPDVAIYMQKHPGQGSAPTDTATYSEFFELPKRDMIFYDERIPVFLQFRLSAPELSSVAFNAYLSRLVLTVNAAAVSFTNPRYSSLGLQLHGQQPATDHQETSYPIFSTVIDRSSLVLVQEPAGSAEGEGVWSALWYLTIPITRPKARLASPRISLSARANLREKSNDTISVWKADKSAGIETPPVEYLTPLTPLNSLNLLEGLAHDVVFAGNPPVLAANKVLPPTAPSTLTSASEVSASAAPGFIRLPRLVCKTYTPVFPCITLRLRCSRLPRATTLSEDEYIVLANVEVDITAFAKVDVLIRKIDLVVIGGKTEKLNGSGIQTDSNDDRFPMKCRPLDGISEIFKLYPLSAESNAGSNRSSGASIVGHGGMVVPGGGGGDSQSKAAESSKNLTRSITVRVEYSPVLKEPSDGEVGVGYGPEITTMWNTTVDFSATGSGTLGLPQQQIEQNRNSQAMQPITGSRSVSGRSSSAWLQMQQQQLRSPSGTVTGESPMMTAGPWGVNTSQPQPTPSASREIVHEGFSLTFFGPTEVLAGQIFVWKVYIINRSRTAKRISLIVQPKKWKGNKIKVLPPSAQQNVSPSTIIMDDTVLYNAHRTGLIESDELISLVNDIRIGPLGPGASHETELKLVALGVGVLSLDGVRVVDLATGEGFECTNLMNVICRPG